MSFLSSSAKTTAIKNKKGGGGLRGGGGERVAFSCGIIIWGNGRGGRDRVRWGGGCARFERPLLNIVYNHMKCNHVIIVAQGSTMTCQFKIPASVWRIPVVPNLMQKLKGN